MSGHTPETRPYSAADAKVVRHACTVGRQEYGCRFPHCRCIKTPAIVFAAIAALAKATERTP